MVHLLRQSSRLATAVALAAITGTWACAGPGDSGRGDVPEGTREMADRLRRVREEAEPGGPYQDVGERLRQMRAAAPGREATVREYLTARRAIARIQLRAGRFDAAAATADSVLTILERSGAAPPREFLRGVRRLRATAHLRRWMAADCVEPSRPPACALPPEPRAGASAARRAAAGFGELLTRDSTDLEAAWLLNVSRMAAGEWPAGVEGRWRLPPDAVEPEASLRPLRDVAPAQGLDVLGQAGGSVLADFDGDLDLDLMVSSSSLADPIRYFENRGAEGFVERTGAAGLEPLTGGLQLEHADYDDDGDVDVYVLRGGWHRPDVPNSLLENVGGGRFRDVTAEAGLLDPAPTQTAAWGDYDGDGDLDLFVGHETQPGSGEEDPSSLYRNDGDGTFTEVSERTGLDVVGWVKGAVWGDYDNDGRPDLYLSRMDGPNRLFRNESGPDGGTRFRDVAAEAGVREPGKSFPAWWFDYDNDGWLDLFVSGYDADVADVAAEAWGRSHDAALPRLYRNRGDGTFEDVTEELGLDRVLEAMGSNYGDLDGDGRLDLYVGTGDPRLRTLIPSRAFLNRGESGFREVTTVGTLGRLDKGHGVSFGDADGDGDQDVSAVFGGAHPGDRSRNAFLENPGPEDGRREGLTLILRGTESNRSAVGARVRVTLATPDGERTLHRVVSTGGSFGGNSLRLELGLGDATGVRSVAVRWPASGRRDVYRGLTAGAAYVIREGSERAERVRVPETALTPPSGEPGGGGP